MIHAAWQANLIEMARALPLGSVIEHYERWERAAQQRALDTQLEERMAAELARWGRDLENRDHEPPFMHALAEHEANKQMMNPLKVLTSGVERVGTEPFYSSGKWRFCDRVAWWNEYADATPVVVGHYWRRVRPIDRATVEKEDQDLFEAIHPHAWHGKQGNVFCVNYSVGGRWTERKAGTPVGQDFKLAALRWPERVVQFDDGHVVDTIQ